MAKPDRLEVISPVQSDGTYQFWTPCRTGKMPVEGRPSELSLTFKLPNSFYSFKYKVEDLIGRLDWHQYDHSHYRALQKNLFIAMPKVFKKYKFKGSCFAVGIARRPSKKAWEFTLSGMGFKFDENFILAKLMDQETFERLIWEKAVRMTYPGRRFKNAT